MKNERKGRVMIECPNTIFHLYVGNENDLTKIEIFMDNLRHVKKIGINDIYNWCNRQGITYYTRFNYRKEFSIWKNMKAYYKYYTQKMKYQVRYSYGT
ncbi:MAG: hypothetical protein UH963_07240 [Agathobacter sp.]|nr:hypothetical protein [Agathobacter sp.]